LPFLEVQIVEGELSDAFGDRFRVEENLGVDPCVRRLDDGRTGRQGAYEAQNPFTLRLGNAIGLVDDDEVGEAEMPVDLGVPEPDRVELGGVDELDGPS